MTKQLYTKYSTEFGAWLRKQKEIDSSLGFITTDLDYIWCNYKTGKWMIIEEKKFNNKITFCQHDVFMKIDKLCKADPLYCGFHTIVFEKTNPDDGLIYIDDVLSTREQLIHFLTFQNRKIEKSERVNYI